MKINLNSSLNFDTSKDGKNSQKNVIELANSVSILNESTPMISKQYSSDNINEYLFEGLTDSKDKIEKKKESTLEDDNQIHLFNQNLL